MRIWRKLLRSGHDHGGDAGLHPAKQRLHGGVVPEDGIESGDDAQDHEGRDDGAQNRDQDPGQTAELITHHDGAVHCDGSRRRLGDGDHIQHLFLIDPVQLIDELLFQQCNDHISSPEGKGAQEERGEEEFFQDAGRIISVDQWMKTSCVMYADSGYALNRSSDGKDIDKQYRKMKIICKILLFYDINRYNHIYWFETGLRSIFRTELAHRSFVRTELAHRSFVRRNRHRSSGSRPVSCPGGTGTGHCTA